jgi:acetyl-CoA C-acetyltransferase
MMSKKRVAVVGGVRTPFVRSFGKYMERSNQDLMTFTLQELVKRYKLQGRRLGDVALGSVLKSPFDWNLARESVLGSDLDAHTPAFDLQRACGTSLEAVIAISNKIALGQIEVGIAGGTDTNSDVPITIGDRIRRRILRMRAAKGLGERLTSAVKGFLPSELALRFPTADEPRTGLRMGDHCELMAKEWEISREAQDEEALKSQRTAAQAYEQGFYRDLVIPYAGVERDQFVRPDTSLEKLSSLKPAFDRQNGSLTAGNSTPLSDGASCVLLASEEYAKAQGWEILAFVRDAQVAAVDFVHGEGLLMAPTYAVARLLERNGLRLQDFDLYEIHEAFAAQLLCTLKAWESESYCREKLNLAEPLGSIDAAKINTKGGSVALGHPFAATGTRIVASLAKMLATEQVHGRGLVSICTAGGMGVTAILEGPQT